MASTGWQYVIEVLESRPTKAVKSGPWNLVGGVIGPRAGVIRLDMLVQEMGRFRGTDEERYAHLLDWAKQMQAKEMPLEQARSQALQQLQKSGLSNPEETEIAAVADAIQSRSVQGAPR